MLSWMSIIPPSRSSAGGRNRVGPLTRCRPREPPLAAPAPRRLSFAHTWAGPHGFAPLRRSWYIIHPGPRPTAGIPMTQATQEKTGLGNYFVANYPPFSLWKPAYLADAHAALDRAPNPATPLGLYLHIPFCRKRCKFCYFRV